MQWWVDVSVYWKCKKMNNLANKSSIYALNSLTLSIVFPPFLVMRSLILTYLKHGKYEKVTVMILVKNTIIWNKNSEYFPFSLLNQLCDSFYHLKRMEIDLAFWFEFGIEWFESKFAFDLNVSIETINWCKSRKK